MIIRTIGATAGAVINVILVYLRWPSKEYLFTFCAFNTYSVFASVGRAIKIVAMTRTKLLSFFPFRTSFSWFIQFTASNTFFSHMRIIPYGVRL